MEQTKINYMNIDDLIPYVNNPRNNDHAVDAVASSIKNFGFKVPIVVDGDHEIINGHTRYKAALKLGIKDVPVIVATDLTPAQVKAFRLADNKVAEIAEWNEEALQLEMAELEDMDLDIDMIEFGFEPIVLEETEMLDIDEEEVGQGVSFDHVLRIDNQKIPLTEQEYETFIERYERYVDINGVAFGFMGELMEGE